MHGQSTPPPHMSSPRPVSTPCADDMGNEGVWFQDAAIVRGPRVWNTNCPSWAGDTAGDTDGCNRKEMDVDGARGRSRPRPGSPMVTDHSAARSAGSAGCVAAAGDAKDMDSMPRKKARASPPKLDSLGGGHRGPSKGARRPQVSRYRGLSWERIECRWRVRVSCYGRQLHHWKVCGARCLSGGDRGGVNGGEIQHTLSATSHDWR